MYEIFDAEHSDFEDRFLAIGPSDHDLLVVVFTEPDDDRIRIFSARRASERERALYRAFQAPSNRPRRQPR